MSEINRSDFQALQNTYRSMPYGAGRLRATLDALSLAQQLDTLTRTQVLFDLSMAYAIGDDPAKALPVCAEFLALMEECPAYPRQRIEAPYVAMIAFVVTLSLPQIRLEQCRVLQEEFHRQVKKYGLGERIWQLYTCAFYLDMDDTATAQMHLEAFYQSKRDEISNCAACEAGNTAECLLNLGRREEAWAVLQPVLDGSLRCEDQPWSALCLLIHDALDHHELDRAKALGQQLSRKALRKKGDLTCVGARLRLCALDHPEQILSLLEKGLRWSVGIWDQRLLFNFYQGAWCACSKLSECEERTPLSLPKKFALWQADGLYHSATLAQWLYQQMTAIARRFDQRNGSTRFSRQIPPFHLPGGTDKTASQNSEAESMV